MNEETYDAILSDWIICEVDPSRRFLAGRITGDRQQRFKDGVYMTTSLLRTPIEQVVDGAIVQTLNSRYLLTECYAVDDALFAKLDAWIAAQPIPPTLKDVLATKDIELISAYMLRGFRQATAEAVWQRKTLH